jgi:hypothetical protein
MATCSTTCLCRGKVFAHWACACMKPSRDGLVLLDLVLVVEVLDATRTLDVLDDLAIACSGRRAVGWRHCEES